MTMLVQWGVLSQALFACSKHTGVQRVGVCCPHTVHSSIDAMHSNRRGA